jgi:hypothetical protein
MAGLQTRWFLRASGLHASELLPRRADVRSLINALKDLWGRRPPIARRTAKATSG